jgi:hypothetical protein
MTLPAKRWQQQLEQQYKNGRLLSIELSSAHHLFE